MHTYSFPDAKNIVVCGDIHGHFNEVIFKMCVQYQMTDTLLIIAGDCGFGFEKPGYYDIIFNRNSSRLSKSNNWVVMVRGNHDDPAYFELQADGNTLIHHARWQTVPDYAVIKACGRMVLCVGGAVSVDRQIRMCEMDRNLGKRYYWPNETVRYDAEALEAIRDAGLKVDTVVTHTAPSMCEFQSKQGLATWAQCDATLLDDCKAERAAMDDIIVHLKQDKHPLERWYYGHLTHGIVRLMAYGSKC